MGDIPAIIQGALFYYMLQRAAGDLDAHSDQESFFWKPYRFSFPHWEEFLDAPIDLLFCNVIHPSHNTHAGLKIR